MASTTTKTTGFEGLRCIHCGELDSLNVKVNTLALECGECGEEVTRDEIVEMFERWGRLIDWIDSAATFVNPK